MRICPLLLFILQVCCIRLRIEKDRLSLSNQNSFIELTERKIRRRDISHLNNKKQESCFDININGLIGVYKIGNICYLACVMNAEEISFVERGVNKVLEIGLVRIPTHSTIDDSHLQELVLLQKTLAKHSFYYSTRNYQICNRLQHSSANLSYIAKEANEFIWNRKLINEKSSRLLSPFFIPIVNAIIQQTTIVENNKKFDVYLVSRRSVFQQGLR